MFRVVLVVLDVGENGEKSARDDPVADSSRAGHRLHLQSEPALGQHGVNIMEFCKAFNAQTKDKQGLVIPAVITVYADRSFSFILKSPLASVLLKRAAKGGKGLTGVESDKGGDRYTRSGSGDR